MTNKRALKELRKLCLIRTGKTEEFNKLYTEIKNSLKVLDIIFQEMLSNDVNLVELNCNLWNEDTEEYRIVEKAINKWLEEK